MVKNIRNSLGRITLSEKLPQFSQQRKGTQVFIFERGELISVYDDYSVYPDGKASKWKVLPCNRIEGYCYDRICMKNGIYPSRERAVEEVMRFKDRGESLIFYVVPVNFSYDAKKHLWPESELYTEQGYADMSQQQAEAKKRLLFMTGRRYEKDIDLAKKYKGTVSEIALKAFSETQRSAKVKNFPYAVLGLGAILYVGSNKSDWFSERACMGIDYGESGDGCTSGYVYNFSCPELSEYGDIFYRYRNGSLYRSA